MSALGESDSLLTAASGLSQFYGEHIFNTDKSITNMNGASTTVVVKGPISYHRLFKRAPQFGQASALLLTSCPQSLHGLSRANYMLPSPVSVAYHYLFFCEAIFVTLPENGVFKCAYFLSLIYLK